MYMEGSTKGLLSLLAAILLVVSVAFWPQTKFVARFLYDLLIMNALDGIHYLVTSLQQYWQLHNPLSH